MFTFSTRTILPVLTLIMLLGTSCKEDVEEDPVIPENTSAMLTQYATIVHVSYEDSLATAKTMNTSIDAFIAAPSAAGLEKAKTDWLLSREPYLQTEVYRFYGGPIDNETDGPEGLLNAWPLDENYIDYVQDNPAAGLVNSTGTIDAAQIESLNEAGGEKNIATGYHAIEFLLWGQDLNADGPGTRPFTDYVEDDTATAQNADRRKLYLTTSSELLLTHLEQLVTAWAPGQDNYRKTFLADTDAQGLTNVLTGMIILSGFETGGERLQTALDSGDQEDEHSCFSDNTHRDMIQDVQGVQNVFLGTYTGPDGTAISGTGVKDVIAARDQKLADDLDAQIKESLALANALDTPFDKEIAQDNTEGRARVTALIVALRKQEDLLQDAFRLFELDIPEAE